MPGMLNKLSDFARAAPRRYALMDAGIIDAMAEACVRMLGDSVVVFALASLVRATDAGGISGAECR